jgi:hypothetical protein
VAENLLPSQEGLLHGVSLVSELVMYESVHFA